MGWQWSKAESRVAVGNGQISGWQLAMGVLPYLWRDKAVFHHKNLVLGWQLSMAKSLGGSWVENGSEVAVVKRPFNLLQSVKIGVHH